MSIPIGEHYRLDADKHNIILYSNLPADEEKIERAKNMIRKTRGEDFVFKEQTGSWVPEGYFNSVHNALKYLAELELRKTNLENMQVVVDKMADIYQMIEKSCQNITVSNFRE